MRSPSVDPKDCSNVSEKPPDTLDPRESGQGLSLGDGMQVDAIVENKIAHDNNYVESKARFDGTIAARNDGVAAMEVGVTLGLGSGGSTLSYAAMVSGKAKVPDVSNSLAMDFDLSTVAKSAVSTQKSVTVIPLVVGDDRNLGDNQVVLGEWVQAASKKVDDLARLVQERPDPGKASDATGLPSTKPNHSVILRGLVDAVVSVEHGVTESHWARCMVDEFRAATGPGNVLIISSTQVVRNQIRWERMLEQASGSTRLSPLLIHLMRLLGRSWTVRIIFVPWEGNMVAGGMTKFVRQEDLICHRFLSPPDEILSMLHNDVSD
ncbi:hypothetical protein V6N13_106781 [Hibiscus sabdariffa]